MRYLFLILGCFSCLLRGEVSTFSGTAYDEHHKHLFTEEYTIEKDQDKILSVTTRFLSPQGDLLGEMHSNFLKQAYLPSVNFTKKEKNLSYGSSLLEQSIELFKTNASHLFKRKTFTIKDNMVVGHGFYFYILDKLDLLLSGKSLQMLFLQPNRLNMYTFNVKASQDPHCEQLVRIHLTIDHRLLKPFVPEIQLVINKATKTLVSYEGCSGFLSEDHSLKKIFVRYTPVCKKDS